MSFAGAARRYWLGVFPRVCLERRRRKARASRIPDPLLRGTALDAQRKWGNVEGAAAFAAFVPSRHRAAAARAMTCFQAAYNYLDMLGEQPCADPVANGRRLHSALLVALDPDAAHLDYYEHCRQREDGGYLREILDACRAALATLPSYSALAPAALRAAERIVEFQSCNTGELQGDLAALERWARAADPAGEDLRWWETAAAGGLLIGYLRADRARGRRTRLSGRRVGASGGRFRRSPRCRTPTSLDRGAAFAARQPGGRRRGSRHRTAQPDRLYGSPQEAADANGPAGRALAGRRAGLPDAHAHTLVLAAMASFYLSTPEAATPAALPLARAVLGALDGRRIWRCWCSEFACACAGFSRRVRAPGARGGDRDACPPGAGRGR